VEHVSNDFGFWELFFSVFWFMLLVAWIWVIIAIIHDIFSDRSLNGGAKALWTIFVILVPWLGVLIYIFARGDSMNDRTHDRALDAQTRAHDPASFPAYALSSARPNVADELRGLAELHDSGVLTSDEYERAKTKVLAP
jgi:Short C-terminal domain/Phospholipase_D-nuclease N-terminal